MPDSPRVSIVVPTLNSAATLELCLESIFSQEYGGELEVIVADGGSTDGTVDLARRYGCRVVENRLKTGEAGKARGLREADGDVVALIDSDNILEGTDWLERMTAPFADPRISASEPVRFTYRRSDPPLTRYCALIGMNDPLCYFLGNYDRESVLSGTWTGLPVETRRRGGYLEVRLAPGAMPTIGANGFMVRRALLAGLDIGEYLFDIDLVSALVARGNDLFAKVDTGIVHLYGRGLSTFARKQLRRVRDYSYFRSRGERAYGWERQSRKGMLRFVLYTALVLPLVAQALKGCARRPDPAWALHPPACVITLAVYSFGITEGLLRPRLQERSRWKQ